MDKFGAKGARLFEAKAAEYIKDKNKLGKLLNTAFRKGMSLDKLKDVKERFQLGISLLKDWISGEYREIPMGTVIRLTAALLYLVTPTDLIPDFIPLSGYLDDLTVLSYVFSQIGNELDQYKVWKESRGAEEVRSSSGSAGREARAGRTARAGRFSETEEIFDAEICEYPEEIQKKRSGE